VTGAPDGTWPDAAALTVSVTVTVGCGLDETDAAPGDTPGVLGGAVLLAEAEVPDEAEVPEEADAAPVAVGELVTVGEMIVGVDVDEVQAETATGPSRARAAQHSAVSLAPNGVPAVVPRTFMDPPPAPGRCRIFSRSRRQKPESERKRVTSLALKPGPEPGAQAQ
jgi:hypothetical protein